jgi:hypothetical protein
MTTGFSKIFFRKDWTARFLEMRPIIGTGKPEKALLQRMYILRKRRIIAVFKKSV